MLICDLNYSLIKVALNERCLVYPRSSLRKNALVQSVCQHIKKIHRDLLGRMQGNKYYGSISAARINS